jgi:hypothetical protein
MPSKPFVVQKQMVSKVEEDKKKTGFVDDGEGGIGPLQELRGVKRSFSPSFASAFSQ